MNTPLAFLARLGILSGLTGTLLLGGCASTTSGTRAQSGGGENAVASQVPGLPSGVKLKEEKDIEGAWLAPGFKFKGCGPLSVADTIFRGVERPNEVQMRQFATAELQSQMVRALRGTGVFSAVTAGDGASGDARLRLVNTIIEYEKGGGAARYFAGIYGAGQPVIRIRGQMYSGNKVVFVYEASRSGESGFSRVFGAYRSDDDIQREDIRDLAVDLADLIRRKAASP
jgi:hypothetical protein